MRREAVIKRLEKPVLDVWRHRSSSVFLPQLYDLVQLACRCQIANSHTQARVSIWKEACRIGLSHGIARSITVQVQPSRQAEWIGADEPPHRRVIIPLLEILQPQPRLTRPVAVLRL